MVGVYKPGLYTPEETAAECCTEKHSINFYLKFIPSLKYSDQVSIGTVIEVSIDDTEFDDNLMAMAYWNPNEGFRVSGDCAVPYHEFFGAMPSFIRSEISRACMECWIKNIDTIED